MKKCNVCRCHVKNGEKYCHNCGADLTSQPLNVDNIPTKRKIQFNRKTKILCIILSLAILIPSISAIVYRSKYTIIDVSDYIGVTFSGRNGYGNVEAFFIPEDEFRALLRNKSRNVSEKWSDWVDVGEIVKLDVDRNSHLSNGDKVTVSLRFTRPCSTLDFKEMGIILRNTEKTFKVSGLENYVTLDLREYAAVEFAGKNGNGYAGLYLLEPEKFYRDLWDAAGVYVPDDYSVFDDPEYVNDYGGTEASDIFAHFEPDLSKSRNFSNGEKIKINLDEDFYLQHGIKFLPESLEYTVSGLE